MPTIKQLPAATAVTAGDLLPLSQGGLTRSVSVSTLLSGSQTALAIPQDTLLGRVSAGVGGPETVTAGLGILLHGGALSASGADHLSLSLVSSLDTGDEVIVNSNGQPARLTATKLRTLFTAGSGVTIDTDGVISVPSSGGGNSTGSGVSGPKGDTGAQGPAGQGFNFRGAWQSSTAYGAYDVVTYGGQTYVVVSSFVSSSVFTTQNLSLLAAQGGTGVAGSPGPTVAATSSNIGAVKPGSGMTVASDGSLSVSSLSPSTIVQSGASIGQVLAWTGTSWGPTTVNASAVTGVAPIGVNNGAISLLQSGASTGQVLTWTGSTWAPQTVAGPSLGNAAPAMDGTASAGSSTSAARDDHRHPTDLSRAPNANPAFTGSITLPSWTTSTRPSSPALGAEGFASDTGRRETFTASGWIQYVRTGDIVAGAGQLLGGTTTGGGAVAVNVGAGLTLSGNTLSATGPSNASIPTATTTTLGGVKSDGTSVQIASDGTLSVVGVAVSSLSDISSGSLGGPALSDLDVLNRGGTDYKTTLGARTALMRRTPAGSRTIALASGSTVAALTAADHDKTVVITGVAGTLTIDGTITDGFRCQVINHTGSALAYSSITGLQGSTSVANNAACWVTLSNSTVEATASAGAAASYTLPPATTSQIGGVKPDGTSLTIASDGTLSVVTVSTHAIPAATSPVAGDEFQGYSVATSTDLKYTLGQIATFGQSNFQFWTTSTRPSLSASQYAQGFNSTLGRFEFWNGSTWNQHVRLTDLSAATSQLLGGTGAQGSAAAITVGSGLLLTGSTLSATGGASAIVPVTTANSGVSQSMAFPSSGNAAFDITLTGNCTFSLSGGTAGQLQTITLIIRGGAGGFAAALPSGVKWPGGMVPTVDTSAGSYNEFYLRTIDGGSTYSGNY